MATTVTSAALTVELKEQITLNGTVYDQTITHSITGIGNVQKTIINLGNNASHTVAEFASSPRDNQFDVDDLKYIRVTNLDDTEEIVVNFIDASTETAAIQLEAGKSVVLFDTKIAGNSTGATETAGSAISDLKIHNPDSTNTVDVEIVIATA